MSKSFQGFTRQRRSSLQKCGGTSHYWKSDKMSFECKKCKFRTSLRSGTVMEHSRLPFRYWLLAIHLMTSTKKSISALEMQRQLGHKFYEPIWEMMHKIRLMMGKRDANYVLDDTVELDEGFITQVKESKDAIDKDEDTKRGIGSQNKAKVLVMTSTEPVEEYKKHEKPSKLKSLKMLVVRDLSAFMIEAQVKACIDSKATVKTDGFKSYGKLKTMVALHQEFIVPPKEASSV